MIDGSTSAATVGNPPQAASERAEARAAQAEKRRKTLHAPEQADERPHPGAALARRPLREIAHYLVT
ncbi:MAG TPA: hypothetical protein VIK91_13415 [Nannocystis sp.]